MDDESLVLYLGSNNIIKLTKPGQKDAGGVFQATIWVDRSVFIEFQTTRGSTSDGELAAGPAVPAVSYVHVLFPATELIQTSAAQPFELIGLWQMVRQGDSHCHLWLLSALLNEHAHNLLSVLSSVPCSWCIHHQLD